MALTKDRINLFTQRIMMSRMRILMHHTFYGLLLMKMRFSVDETVETAYTDGERIVFGTEFLSTLKDEELDYVMMHEILHVVLQHCLRGKDLDDDLFNEACDIVVDSNILLENDMRIESITIEGWGPSDHLAPNGEEGYLYTAEEVYVMMLESGRKPEESLVIGESSTFALGRALKEQGEICDTPNQKSLWDIHTEWGIYEEDDTLQEVWHKNLLDATQVIAMEEEVKARGRAPLFAKRMLSDLHKTKIDWRTLLTEFVQEETNDYSFSPPDKRFIDSNFFLPDFNEKEDTVKNVLFMVDTSGSMSDKDINKAYSAIKDAISSFGGKLSGWVGFFDAAIIDPIPFDEHEELKIENAVGGGGTDFQIIFEYVQEYMMDNLPSHIIILTDGFAPFPREHLAMGIPVLWLLTDDNVKPPWGKVAIMS